MKQLVLGITGASGAPYARATIEALVAARARGEVSFAAVLSTTAPEVWTQELPHLEKGDVREYLAARDVPVFGGRDYRAPFASGSAKWDAMAIVPCSMSTLSKIAHGTSDDLLSRAADVFLKERRKLVLVARETPLSLVHLENMLTVTRAGAVVLPACPSFYMRPASVDEVVHTVVSRVLDHLGVEHAAPRWGGADR